MPKSDFPGDYSAVDAFAFRAAVEAVIGLTIQGKEVNLQTVKAWLEAAVNLEIPTRSMGGRAMYFDERIINGPFPPDGPGGVIFVTGPA